MASKTKPFVGDIGTDIILDVGEDISGATISILVIKPNGVTATWQGSVFTVNTISTAIRYKTVDGDFDMPGIYRVQPVVTLSDGSWSGRGNFSEFEVFA
jgi:hypothetical protein